MHNEDESSPSIGYAIAIWRDGGSRHSARLRVDEHPKSGLRMVSGRTDAGKTPSAGEIIGADQDVEAAIRRVGEQIAAPAQLIADCIASIRA